MQTFSLWRGNVRNKRGGERMARWRFFVVSKKCLKKTLLVLPDCVFLRFFCFFYSFRALCLHSFTRPLRMFEKNAFTTSLHLLSLSHTDQKTPQIILSKVSRDIKRTREELFSFSERAFRCAAEQQRLLFHRLCFFNKIVSSRARVRIMYMRRAHFNYPPHGAALSHVVGWLDDDRAKEHAHTRLFRAKEEDKKKNR